MALFDKLPQTSARVGMLMADFSGLNKLDDIVRERLNKLIVSDQVQANVAYVQKGSWSLQQFDGWFASIVRAELGKTLGIVRAKAMQKVPKEAGDAASAVLRRMYKDRMEGNINIAGNRKRISNRHRIIEEPTGGKSGIRRPRTIKPRTKDLREYYGPDRGFILRILENGRDVYMATPEGPTGRGSMATYGKRGSLSPRSFFHSVRSDMEQAAAQLGQTLINHVEKWIDQNFTEK